jgi:8-oxo-dGTP pyrophosphatase MutT (NUDIX family)
LEDHPFWVGHPGAPEFKSRPTRPAPLFAAFVEAAARRLTGRTAAAEPGESTETASSKADGEPANGRDPVGVGAGRGIGPGRRQRPRVSDRAATGWARPEMSSAAGFSVKATTPIHSGYVIDMVEAEMCDPDGGVHARDVVRHPGAVSILPLHDDGTVTLVRQYRVAPDGDLLEIPAGKADRNDEDPVELALRELAEEVGLAASSCVRLAGFYLSPGYSDEWHETFLATGLSEVPTEFDGVEERHMDLVRLDLDRGDRGGRHRRHRRRQDDHRTAGRRTPGSEALAPHDRGPVAVAGEVVSPTFDPTVEAFLGWLRVERGRASRPPSQAYRRDLLAHLAWLDGHS